jgi:tetratricopeptide (TPR) repeat protein
VLLLVPPLALLALTGWNLTRSDGLEEARGAYARGDLATSLSRSLDHLDRRPWSREAALMAARSLSRLDFADLAEPYYRRAGALALEDLQVRAYGLVRANRRAQAIEAYEAILARWPENLTALRRLAAVQLTEKNQPQLQGLADRLIAAPGGATIGYTLRGTEAYNDANHEQVVLSFERVLALDPELKAMPLPHPLFWSNLADSLMKLGRFDDVKKHLTGYLAAHPDASLMMKLGRAHHLSGEFDEAERCFRQAAEWDPEDFTPWFQLGKLELQRQRPAAALAHLEAASRRNPRQADVLFALASAYRLLGRPADAARADGLLADVRGGPARPEIAGPPAGRPWPSHAL